MNIDIKEYIRNNFKNTTVQEIRQSIEEGVNQNDELFLPGLGALFDVAWQNSDEHLRNEILTVLHNSFSATK